MKTKARNFAITIFDIEWVIPDTLPGGLTYLCGQKEQCATTGKIHWQLFARTVNPVRFDTVKKYIGCNSAHIEIARNANEARSYCFKTETRYDFPFELGVWRDIGRPKCKTLDDNGNDPDDEAIRKELYRRISEIHTNELKIYFKDYIPEPKLYYRPTTPVSYRWCSLHEDMDECWNKLNESEDFINI